ncbi:MAG: hypothetical protein CVU11_16075 [Bacteroidetes bacterium HGW-Bacteroidetes-6]|jgi:hypothetical protein|nr:MAG: hypothetical protein CVU11_16075 [Bacteroidetes bacterium HGW-Bacteroidetes-6]
MQISIFAQEQDFAFNIYVYDYASYPEVEKTGTIEVVNKLVLSQRSRDLKYSPLEAKNRIENKIYYDIRNNFERTYKIALEVNWDKVKEVNIIIDKDFQRDNISLLSNGGGSDRPDYLLTDGGNITTHFLFNRLQTYFKLNIDRTRPDLDAQSKEEILNQTMDNVIFNKIKVKIEVKFTGDERLEEYELIPRNSGLASQFQRKVDLSLTYTNDNIVGNVFLSAPFRIRAKRPSATPLDFRWVGDVVSFGPTFVIENSTTQPVGVGGFIGLGLSENGQMMFGFTGGYLFDTKTEFYGISYNAIGFIDGLIDLFNGKPAWNQN